MHVIHAQHLRLARCRPREKCRPAVFCQLINTRAETFTRFCGIKCSAQLHNEHDSQILQDGNGELLEMLLRGAFPVQWLAFLRHELYLFRYEEQEPNCRDSVTTIRLLSAIARTPVRAIDYHQPCPSVLHKRKKMYSSNRDMGWTLYRASLYNRK